MSGFSRQARGLACAILVVVPTEAHAAVAIAVQTEVVGRTPLALGYNLGHFEENSNAADCFRYSGADAARMFIARKVFDKSDHIGAKKLKPRLS